MKVLTLGLIALLAQAPAPVVYKTCAVQQVRTGSDAIVKHGLASKWACTTNTTPATTLVSKAWFKANCYGYGDNTATCQTFAPIDTTLKAKDAAGPSVWKHRLEDIAIGAVGVAIIAACAYSGGSCGGAFGG